MVPDATVNLVRMGPGLGTACCSRGPCAKVPRRFSGRISKLLFPSPCSSGCGLPGRGPAKANTRRCRAVIGGGDGRVLRQLRFHLGQGDEDLRLGRRGRRNRAAAAIPLSCRFLAPVGETGFALRPSVAYYCAARISCCSADVRPQGVYGPSQSCCLTLKYI